MLGQRLGVICCGMASELDDARRWSRMFCAALRAELRRPSDADEDARAYLDSCLSIIERDLRDYQDSGDARDLLDDYRFWRERWPEMNGPGGSGPGEKRVSRNANRMAEVPKLRGYPQRDGCRTTLYDLPGQGTPAV